MTEKHRDQLAEAVRMLALNIEDGSWAGLEVVAAIGLRDPETNDVTLHIRVKDPARRLYGAGIEGLVQLGPNRYTTSRYEAAEHLAQLLAQDAINFKRSGQ